MCNDLRKVTFTLGSYEFLPDPTPKEKEEMEELSKQRSGYFHRWADYVDTSNDIPYVKTMALVEDSADGTVYMVEYHNLKFSEALSWKLVSKNMECSYAY